VQTEIVCPGPKLRGGKMPYTLDKYNLGNRIIRDDKGNVVISKPIPFLRTEKLKLEKEMIEILNKLNTAQPKTNND